MKWTAKRVLSWFLGLTLVGTILFYAYYQSRAIREGPQILVSSPANGETVTTPLIHVVGAARHTKEIYLDGRPIFVDLDGNFHEELLLMDGYNIIELTAKDTEGREEKKIIELVYTGEGNRTTTTSAKEIPQSSSSSH